MRIASKLLLWLCPALSLATLAAGVGEFEIRGTLPLDQGQREAFRQLTQGSGAARAMEQAIKEEVETRRLLSSEPNPLQAIHYEGLVNTDPRRVATVARLREMDDVALLVRYWQPTEDSKAGEVLRRYIGAWSKAYRPTGNDVLEQADVAANVAEFVAGGLVLGVAGFAFCEKERKGEVGENGEGEFLQAHGVNREWRVLR